MKKPVIKAVDAVMGTGKSTWAIEEIKRTTYRYIVVLPYNDEITRYAEALEDHVNIAALDDRVYASETTKSQAFIDALEYSDCIIITHKLFEDYITRETLSVIEQGEWHLIIDETPCTFEEQHGLDAHDILAFEKDGIAHVLSLTDTVSQLVLNESRYDWYRAEAKVKPARKALVKNLIHRDFLIVNTSEGKDDYYMYTLSTRLLNAFQGVTLLTYLFKGSEMDIWCRFNGYQVDHLELLREGQGHRLQPHSGTYTGLQFKELMTVVAPQGRGRRYGDGKFDLSNNQMKKITKDSQELKEIQQGLRNFKLSHKFDPVADFMFTCRKDVIDRDLLPSRQANLYKSYVGEQNWLAFNARGLNDWKEKHFIYYGVNVFQFPRVSLTLKGLGYDYDEDHFALSMMLQFLWRSAIRQGEKITVAIQSKRMRDLLLDWLAGDVPALSAESAQINEAYEEEPAIA